MSVGLQSDVLYLGSGMSPEPKSFRDETLEKVALTPPGLSPDTSALPRDTISCISPHADDKLRAPVHARHLISVLRQNPFFYHQRLSYWLVNVLRRPCYCAESAVCALQSFRVVASTLLDEGQRNCAQTSTTCRGS